MQFRWIAWNRDHVAEHGVEPEEAETVIRQAEPPFPQQVGDDRLLVMGRGQGGRFLQVVYVLEPDDAVYRVQNGKITDHWGVGNLLSLMRQIGGWTPPPEI